MLDVYSDKGNFVSKLEDFKFVDKGTYKISNYVSYYERFYGGP